MNRTIRTTAPMILAAGLCIGLAACDDNDDHDNNTPGNPTSPMNPRDNTDTSPTTPATPPDPADRAPSDDRSMAPAPDRAPNPTTNTSTNNNAAAASADARILSLLHAKNQEEIAIGKLAQERGMSDAVKSYGRMLVDDHTASDERVRAAASAANVSLTEPPASPAAVSDLRALSGDAFDHAFAEKMRAGHAELIKAVEDAQGNVRDSNVRQLLADTLPTLRKHQEHADDLAS